MIDALLILNTGSSSLKFQVFARDGLAMLMAGKLTGIGGDTRLAFRLGPAGARDDSALACADHEAALATVIDLIDRHDEDWRLVAVAHRIVHGGSRFTGPVVVTPQVAAALEALIPLAPLHQPHNLAGLAAARALAPGAVNIACFDTAFHAGHEALFHSFALPADLRDKGVRRYGFHGLSYAWIATWLGREEPDLAAGRVVAAHLGNGASLCAIAGGRSIDTTMGMTALDGLPMGTRVGAIDAGAVTYMMRAFGHDPDTMDAILYERSGLKGLSGISNDVAALLASSDPGAAFALDYFALKVAQFIAVMAVSMGGIDTLVFTGGIGENAAPVRDAILERIAFLGDIQVRVVPADEERMMAIQAGALLGAA
ncbi:acetate/propionate family kinase [Sphingobium algorifonticola]|jgi:acetate kinase|uniref:Acetate kinase n=1 Tax=Sphingobium algorifonticola TaxID=2008318 RepID=A0A437J2A0_9SPHN|nr:acetate/propionate family kinase [Sphingobium algorifonticola]RVT38260.1 acetate/propionate family kinase [Sphingobium algorifonticola]